MKSRLYYKGLRVPLALLVVTLSFWSSFASAEYYDERPSILRVEAKDHRSTGTVPYEWTKASSGHFAFLAQALTFFPNGEYYFLARDIEYLYDMAQVLLKNNAELRKRLHLVPISTALSFTQTFPDMVKYLEQQGLSKEKLAGRTPVFLDSCCSGSIPDRISEAFQPKDIETRGFLIEANSYPRSQIADFLGANGSDIESLPHYTETATEYKAEGKKIRIKAAPGGEYYQTQALAIMQQIRFDFDNTASRAKFAELVEHMRTVYSYLVKGESGRRATKAQVNSSLREMALKFNIPVSAFLEDLRSLQRKNYATLDHERFSELLGPKSRIRGYENRGLAERLMREPFQFETLKNSEVISDWQGVFDEIFLLADKPTTPASLGLTAEQFRSNMITLLSEYEDSDVYDPYYLEKFANFVRLEIKFDEPVKAIERLINNLSEYDDNKKSNNTIRQLIVEALAHDRRRGKTSTLEFLLNDFSFVTEHTSLFKSAMKSFLKDANQNEIKTATGYLVKVTANFLESPQERRAYYGYGDESNTASQRAFVEVLKASIEASPTISSRTLRSILESDLAWRLGDSRFKSFARWLFTQDARIESSARDLMVSSTIAHLLTGARITETNSQTTVRDVIHHYIAASGRGGQCSAVFGN